MYFINVIFLIGASLIVMYLAIWLGKVIHNVFNLKGDYNGNENPLVMIISLLASAFFVFFIVMSVIDNARY